jgi:hypothetical protein
MLPYREGVFVLARCALVVLCIDVGKYIASDVCNLRYVARGLKFETRPTSWCVFTKHA